MKNLLEEHLLIKTQLEEAVNQLTIPQRVKYPCYMQTVDTHVKLMTKVSELVVTFIKKSGKLVQKPNFKKEQNSSTT